MLCCGKAEGASFTEKPTPGCGAGPGGEGREFLVWLGDRAPQPSHPPPKASAFAECRPLFRGLVIDDIPLVGLLCRKGGCLSCPGPGLNPSPLKFLELENPVWNLRELPEGLTVRRELPRGEIPSRPKCCILERWLTLSLLKRRLSPLPDDSEMLDVPLAPVLFSEVVVRREQNAQ